MVEKRREGGKEGKREGGREPVPTAFSWMAALSSLARKETSKMFSTV